MRSIKEMTYEELCHIANIATGGYFNSEWARDHKEVEVVDMDGEEGLSGFRIQKDMMSITILKSLEKTKVMDGSGIVKQPIKEKERDLTTHSEVK